MQNHYNFIGNLKCELDEMSKKKLNEEISKKKI